MRSPHPARSTERCPSPVKGRSAKPQHSARTESGVQIPLSPPKLLKNYQRALCAFFRGLFQYGLLHLGQTLGSPTVVLRGIHSWGQRIHLYPFCLIVTSAMKKIIYQYRIYCQVFP